MSEMTVIGETGLMSSSVIDARGKRCPGPIIELAKAVRELPSGTELTLISDDPGAQSDVPAWCRLKGVDFLGSTPHDDGAAEVFSMRLP